MPYTIPELVTGIPLQVADANNYFSIDFGGLPNGEDCLIVSGHTSGDYKAHQVAQTLIPNAMLDRTAAPFSITVWLKFPVGYSGAGAPAGVLFAVMNSAFDRYFLRDTFVWSFVANGDGIAYYFGSSSADQVVQVSLADDQWHLITVVHGPGTTRTMYKDLLDTPSTQNAGGLEAVASGMHLCIGAWSDIAGVNGHTGVWRIGKLAVHDHPLTLAERTTLYNAMTLG